jgi:hypothetical protein
MSSSKYALSTSHWLSVVDKTSVKAVKSYVLEFPCGAITPSARNVHDKDGVTEEPGEVKVSRPVLKPSGGGDPVA